MDALSLLKEDHDRVKKMLADGEETTERAEKTRTELLARLKHDLTIHERLEEEVLYPALKKEDAEARDLAFEGYAEHHVVDTVMAELEATPVTAEEWTAKFKVMKENIEHHIEEEENEMFREAREAFSRDELVEMGRRMAEIKELAQQVEPAPPRS